ncbi:MAG: chitin synthase-domain-containing protein, partial [Olpidium bornovanus]
PPAPASSPRQFFRSNFFAGHIGVTAAEIDQRRRAGRLVSAIGGDVYDLTLYDQGQRIFLAPPNYTPMGSKDFLPASLIQLFTGGSSDVTVDTRRSPQCMFSDYVLLVSSILLMSIIGFKFLAALQLSAIREPEEHEKFVIIQVPCYTEDEDSLRKTIDSVAVLRYDDKRKLLVVIADGMIVGGGNDKPTPQIVLDILGHEQDADSEPESLSFLSIGEGNRQHNMGKVYAGLYECKGHVIPYVVVVKVGKATERSRPGNRGKRDSQMILMRFLHHVHHGTPMNPLELEIYHQIKNVIGVHPTFYEYILMVDADTEVLPDSLNRMVSCMVHDSRIMGLCGETSISNEKSTW